MQTINIKGRLLDLSRPGVMGILNITDDSFFDGGKYLGEEQALERTGVMIREGASIIDVGGASSRPGAPVTSAGIETDRVIPVISAIRSAYPEIVISVDTYRSDVAVKAVESGADIVNDISAGDLDPHMVNRVAEMRVPYIAMHMLGTPERMQEDPVYGDVVREVMDYFLRKHEQWDKAGLKDVILDPGIGFGKTVDHNYRLLSAIPYLKELGMPVLVGVSRKSLINKVLHTKPENALNGTTAVHAMALMRGASLLRVHDVKEAMEVCRIYEVFARNDINQDD